MNTIKQAGNNILYTPYQPNMFPRQLAKVHSPYTKPKSSNYAHEANQHEDVLANSNTSTDNSNVDTSQIVSKNSPFQKIPKFIQNRKDKSFCGLNFSTTYGELTQKFSIGKILGSGSNGSVHVVRHRQTGFYLALKKIFKKKITYHQRFITQIKIHLLCNHPNINKLYSVFHDENYVYLLMQLCTEGDLLNKMQTGNYGYSKAKQYVKGIAKGLRYLHMNRIMHRDLKLENIILCFDMPKITDFDLATRYYWNTKINRSVCGSPAYMSPEMFLQCYYNEKIDIWSFGIVCFEILCKYYPFKVDTFEQLYKTVTEGEMKQYPSILMEEARLLLNALLKKNSYDRPCWKQILEQPFFK